MDAGSVDEQCGFDCSAQQAFGLLAGRCFEYSESNSTVSPPSLAAQVFPVAQVEKIPTMTVRYTRFGQPRMEDVFSIEKKQLKLLRRTFFDPAGTSVSYRNSDGVLNGVAWINDTSGAQESQTSDSSADVFRPDRMTETTQYRVNTLEASSDDLTIPLGGVDGGVLLQFAETPDHGSDLSRVWTPGVGFVAISSGLKLSNGTPKQYRLQRVKDVSDGGTCGIN